jgi:Protein of unknown function (DUF3224)
MATHRVTGWIDVTHYDSKPYDQTTVVTLSDVRLSQDFTGGLIGTGIARFFMVQMPDGSAHFTGIERFTGSIAGRTGSFLLRNTGILKDGAVTSEWLILPGSATAELTGLNGTGGVNPSGYFLEFSFD